MWPSGLLLILFGSQEPPNPPIAEVPEVPQAVIEYVDDFAARAQRLFSEFEIIRRESVTLSDDEQWDFVAWSDRKELGRVPARWWFCDGLVRVEYLRPAEATRREVEQVNVWNGSGWFQKVDRDPYASGNEDVVGLYYIYPHPRGGGIEEAFPLFHGAEPWRSFVSFIGLSSVVRDLPLVSIKDDDATLELVFSRGPVMTVTLTFETLPQLQLQRIEHKSFELADDAGTGALVARKALHIMEWADFEAGRLPSRALSVGAVFRHPRITEDAAVPIRIEELVRQSAQPMPIDADVRSVFSPPVATQGYQVGDFRASISYVVGRTRVAVDGYMFELEKAIEGLITDNLSEILDGANLRKEKEADGDEERES